MYREISHLKDSNEAKAAEASNQQDKLKQLEYENNRTLARIADTQKLVDVRSHDLRTKQLALEDTEAELARIRDQNAKLAQNNSALRRDNDKNTAENYDIRKEIDFTEGRNADISIQIRDAELRLKEKEEALYITRREVEGLRITASQGRNDNDELLAQKEALERHAAVLQGQNQDLTGELERFCQTDEILRTQLDRRSRVYGLQSKNNAEIKTSYYRVEEARSRSPKKRY
jgi:chromosome segregation ATPase